MVGAIKNLHKGLVRRLPKDHLKKHLGYGILKSYLKIT
jgi:hypothetical protein